MRVAVSAGRTCLVVDGHLVDVEKASGGSIPPDPSAMFAHWAELRELAASDGVTPGDFPVADPHTLDLPVPSPRQVFGIGLNYADHANESGMEPPTVPLVFPKFPSCVVGPRAAVRVASDSVDWEAELVVVIGTGGSHLPLDDAWSHVAGLTIGQDISDRAVQFEGGRQAQFGLGKSAAGFGPVGPWITTVDELPDHTALEIGCSVNDEVKQDSNTRHLIFDVPALVSYLSTRVRLCSGDLIFTGTPAGVGFGADPQSYLRPGDVITTTIEGLGRLRTVIAADEVSSR